MQPLNFNFNTFQSIPDVTLENPVLEYQTPCFHPLVQVPITLPPP